MARAAAMVGSSIARNIPRLPSRRPESSGPRDGYRPLVTAAIGPAARAVLALALVLGLFAPNAALGSPDSPAPADVMAAYRRVEGWVRSLSPPPATDEGVAGASGACVTLRFGGVVVGRGVSMGEGDDESEAVARAAGRAIAQARERLPVERDAMREEALLDAARAIAIDLQVAHALTPLLGETFDDAGLEAGAGLEGVAVRAGDRVRAYFPGLMLSTNTAPGESLIAASADLDLPRDELARLKREHGVVAYRFGVTHLAQPGPGEEPVFLFRGGRVVALTEVNAANLRRFASGIAAHLQTRLAQRTTGAGADGVERETPGLLGDYEPWRDAYEPLLATPAQRALAAFAAFRFARSGGVDPGAAARASRFGWTILDDIARADSSGAEGGSDAAGSGLTLLALAHAPPRPAEMPRMDAPPLRSALAARCIERATRALRPRTPDEPHAEPVPPPARALLACALARVAGAAHAPDNAPELRARAEEAVRALFRDATPASLPNLMPWLGWAELALLARGEPIPTAPALLEMRDLLWEHQVSPADAGVDAPDLVGGIVFTASRSPLPGWQAARPLAFAATMLADPRLTPPDRRPAEAARLVTSLRFLMQLGVDARAAHMFRDRERSVGGVREAPWNQRMTIEASAMTLLAACEAIDAFGAATRSPGANR